MLVSPADFDLYSRTTGRPTPRSRQEEIQMTPEVYKFIQNRNYQPAEQTFIQKGADFLGKAATVGGSLVAANALAGGFNSKKVGQAAEAVKNVANAITSAGGAGDVDLGGVDTRPVSVSDIMGGGSRNIVNVDAGGGFSPSPSGSPSPGYVHPSGAFTPREISDLKDPWTGEKTVVRRKSPTQQEPGVTSKINPTTGATIEKEPPLQERVSNLLGGTEGDVDLGGGIVNNVSIEKDDEPWKLETYARDKEDPRLARRGRGAASPDDRGAIRKRVEDWTQDVKLERFVPYTSVPLGGGIVAHQAMDVAKVMGGADPASLGSYYGYPIGQTVTDLANRGLTSAVDHIPYVGHGTVEAVKGIGRGLAQQGEAFHSLGNAVSNLPFGVGGWLSDTASAATHLPPFEVVGNVLDAAGHVIQTGTPELILGGLGVAGATAGIGAGRAALQGQKDATATGNLLSAFRDRITGKGLSLYEDHPQVPGGQSRDVPSITIQDENRGLPGGPAGLGAQVESQDINLDGPRVQSGRNGSDSIIDQRIAEAKEYLLPNTHFTFNSVTGEPVPRQDFEPGSGPGQSESVSSLRMNDEGNLVTYFQSDPRKPYVYDDRSKQHPLVEDRSTILDKGSVLHGRRRNTREGTANIPERLIPQYEEEMNAKHLRDEAMETAELLEDQLRRKTLGARQEILRPGNIVNTLGREGRDALIKTIRQAAAGERFIDEGEAAVTEKGGKYPRWGSDWSPGFER